MIRTTVAPAAALAFLVVLFSCLALGLGLRTPQVHGPLFWAVTGGFGIQALTAAVWLARLAAIGLTNAAGRGTGAPAGD